MHILLIEVLSQRISIPFTPWVQALRINPGAGCSSFFSLTTLLLVGVKENSGKIAWLIEKPSFHRWTGVSRFAH